MFIMNGKSIVGIMFVSMFITSCLKDECLKISLNYIPQELEDGIEISSPANEGIDEKAVRELYLEVFSENDFFLAKSLLISRNGKLIAEGYMQDMADRGNLQHIQSATKSVVSLVAGIAYDNGLINDENQTIYSVLPEYFDEDTMKKQITIKHALTMNTGLCWTDNNFEELYAVKNPPESSLRYVISQDLEFLPGSYFNYSNGDPFLIVGLVEKLSGMDFEEYANRNLFAPLEIKNYNWNEHVDGVNYGGNGLYLRPRDMLKIGNLCLNNGKWNNKQVVSEEWLSRSTTAYTNFDHGPYGYYWWIKPDMGAYSADGWGGQYIYMIKEKELVVVFTAEERSDYGWLGVGNEQFEKIIQKIINAST